jgi:hypothetical protein
MANHLIGNATVPGSIRGVYWNAWPEGVGLFNNMDFVVDQCETLEGTPAAVAAFFPAGVVWG